MASALLDFHQSATSNMLKWVVFALAVAVVLPGGSSYSVDADNPPRRYNDIEVGGLRRINGQLGLRGASLEDQLQAATLKRIESQRPTAFITSHGYPVEEYKVTTPDGYILTLFRIPNGVKNATTYGNKEPVFVQHGLMSSAMDFLVTGPDRALGFVLADAGYDVWLGNTRGSSYSRTHRDLNPDERQYWQFSWHEIGERDLPTMINYVLMKTGYKKLHYVGHSQGTTAFFVMCNMYPSMKDKIQTMNAMAPMAFTGNLYSPLVRFLAQHSDTISKLYQYSADNGEMITRDDLMRVAGYERCRSEIRDYELCANMIYLIGGWGSNQLDSEQVDNIMKYSPSSASIFQLAHYAQGVLSGRFGGYDFGSRKNQEKYSKSTPPTYDMSMVTGKVALHYSDNDWMAAVVDVDKLGNRLPNIVGKYRVPDNQFTHMDFCWGKDAKRYVYDRVIGVMRRFPIQENFRSIKGHDAVIYVGVGKRIGGHSGGNDDDYYNNDNYDQDWNNRNTNAGWGINV